LHSDSTYLWYFISSVFYKSETYSPQYSSKLPAVSVMRAKMSSTCSSHVFLRLIGFYTAYLFSPARWHGRIFREYETRSRSATIITSAITAWPGRAVKLFSRVQMCLAGNANMSTRIKHELRF